MADAKETDVSAPSAKSKEVASPDTDEVKSGTEVKAKDGAVAQTAAPPADKNVTSEKNAVAASTAAQSASKSKTKPDADVKLEADDLKTDTSVTSTKVTVSTAHGVSTTNTADESSQPKDKDSPEVSAAVHPSGADGNIAAGINEECISDGSKGATEKVAKTEVTKVTTVYSTKTKTTNGVPFDDVDTDINSKDDDTTIVSTTAFTTKTSVDDPDDAFEAFTAKQATSDHMDDVVETLMQKFAGAPTDFDDKLEPRIRTSSYEDSFTKSNPDERNTEAYGKNTEPYGKNTETYDDFPTSSWKTSYGSNTSPEKSCNICMRPECGWCAVFKDDDSWNLNGRNQGNRSVTFGDYGSSKYGSMEGTGRYGSMTSSYETNGSSSYQKNGRRGYTVTTETITTSQNHSSSSSNEKNDSAYARDPSNSSSTWQSSDTRQNYDMGPAIGDTHGSYQQDSNYPARPTVESTSYSDNPIPARSSLRDDFTIPADKSYVSQVIPSARSPRTDLAPSTGKPYSGGDWPFIKVEGTYPNESTRPQLKAAPRVEEAASYAIPRDIRPYAGYSGSPLITDPHQFERVAPLGSATPSDAWICNDCDRLLKPFCRICHKPWCTLDCESDVRHPVTSTLWTGQHLPTPTLRSGTSLLNPAIPGTGTVTGHPRSTPSFLKPAATRATVCQECERALNPTGYCRICHKPEGAPSCLSFSTGRPATTNFGQQWSTPMDITEARSTPSNVTPLYYRLGRDNIEVQSPVKSVASGRYLGSPSSESDRYYARPSTHSGGVGFDLNETADRKTGSMSFDVPFSGPHDSMLNGDDVSDSHKPVAPSRRYYGFSSRYYGLNAGESAEV